ncbi:hypothetical protein F4820DRAFT_286626 [Hypoxylon rubiginosum]|uniref:Uncharacterized protein n=1 Tax=Hypoxylon rubiginosum TaxID=110542 RepID=A0ACB9ZEZ8_9PEZI|nr:hypothetical protein F4820DRAFT_286626 [Hypoxylon rubiginosum]
MALLGLSLVLASVIYAVIWKPPLIQTLLALWRGHPRIQQPPTTARPSPPELRVEEEDRPTSMMDGDGEASSSPAPAPALEPEPTPTSRTVTDRAAMPPPFVTTPRSARSASTSSQTRSTPSPQTTPKATASAPLNGNSSIPSFSLSPDPPASAAAVARTVGAETSPSALPTLSAPSPPPQPIAPASPKPSAAKIASMAPPPRPPALNAINNARGSGSSLLGVPARGPAPDRLRQQQHAYDRQPGTSTLAPPPTHSSKPAKPSRKVILEPGRSPLDWARLANSPTADLRNLGPGAPYLRVTPSMLKRQTGRKGKDAWTAMGGRVYNITPYLPFHPGGEPELLRAAGRDGTKLFGEIHPWVNYENMLASCMIGLLVEEHEAKSKGEMDGMD